MTCRFQGRALPPRASSATPGMCRHGTMRKSRRMTTMSETVRGHTCEGLQRFQDAGRDCSPYIAEDGTVSGCDDDNDVPILYCPFCGDRLPPVEEFVDAEIVGPGLERRLLNSPADTVARAFFSKQAMALVTQDDMVKTIEQLS